MGSGTTFSSGPLPALPPQSPGVAAYSPSARRKKKKPAVLPIRRASLRPTWETQMIHPTKKVGLEDSRKTRGRASGGLGAAPPVMHTGGAVASRPRNRPLPKAPAAPAAFPLTARVSGCKGQDGQRQRPGVFRASGDVFRGKLGHQEGFWHGVCFPYLDNLGISAGS